jgi:ligand-binding SRPBCC domain-containing protein
MINATVDEVFGFHEREDAFTLLTPRFPPVRLISKSREGIQSGTRVELRVGVFSWIALHTRYEKNKLFVDEQIRGPFSKWIHRHEFEPADGRTLLTDRIEYELPGGRLVNALFRWAVAAGLHQMFNHRHRVTREFCERR